MKYWRGFWYLIRHKWYVFLECVRLGIPWLGLLHDWSKLRPSEFVPYCNRFYGDSGQRARDKTGYYKPTDTGDPSFDLVCLYHMKGNRHHWQFWVVAMEDGGTKVFPMPDRYRREMLADWSGAGRAHRGADAPEWYRMHGHKFRLHPETRAWIEEQLQVEEVFTFVNAFETWPDSRERAIIFEQQDIGEG